MSTAQTTYDVIVIGAGPAGENAADRAGRDGLDVAIVEKELVGGECSYWACMPSKALLRPSEALAAAERVPGARPAIAGGVDVEATLKSRDALNSHLDDSGQVEWLESAGIALERGHGRLSGERTVEVERDDGTVDTLHAREAVVIAVGTGAAMPPIEGLDETRTWDNREATTAKEVPSRLLILGGGVVGVEMAQAWQSLGAQVTVIEMGSRLLTNEEPFVGEQLAAALRDRDVTVETGAKAEKVHRAGTDGPVTVELGDGRALEGDELLVAVGRRPLTDDLGLGSVGLEPDGFIDVDDQLRATGIDGDWLYVVGDANGRALLTHMGKYQARLAGDLIAGTHDPDKSGDAAAWADHSAIPRVVFTDPQVAAVGFTQEQAQEQGLDVRSVSYDIGNTAGAATTGQDISGTVQIVIDSDRDVIVGATFVGPGVGEMLHAATIAIVGEVPLARLWHAVPSFPTMSEVWLRLLEADGH